MTLEEEVAVMVAVVVAVEVVTTAMTVKEVRESTGVT
jgi:hypothetical protein